MMTYEDKKYLDYKGLVHALSLIKDTYLDRENFKAIPDSEIETLFCAVHGCVSEDEPKGTVESNVLHIT